MWEFQTFFSHLLLRFLYNLVLQLCNEYCNTSFIYSWLEKLIDDVLFIHFFSLMEKENPTNTQLFPFKDFSIHLLYSTKFFFKKRPKINIFFCLQVAWDQQCIALCPDHWCQNPVFRAALHHLRLMESLKIPSNMLWFPVLWLKKDAKVIIRFNA